MMNIDDKLDKIQHDINGARANQALMTELHAHLEKDVAKLVDDNVKMHSEIGKMHDDVLSMNTTYRVFIAVFLIIILPLASYMYVEDNKIMTASIGDNKKDIITLQNNNTILREDVIMLKQDVNMLLLEKNKKISQND